MTKKLSIILIALLFGGENLMAAENNNQFQPNIYNTNASPVTNNSRLITVDQIPEKMYDNLEGKCKLLIALRNGLNERYDELLRMYNYNELHTEMRKLRRERIVLLREKSEVFIENMRIRCAHYGIDMVRAESNRLHEQNAILTTELNERERALGASNERYNELQMEYNELQKKYNKFKGRA